MADPCWCATCRPVTFGDMRMVLCPVCGNKRCPRASNHVYACTGSNDVGQVGVDVADMAHLAPQRLKYGADMSPEEIEAIAQRPTYCKTDGEAVTLSRAERDALVAMARRYGWLRDADPDAGEPVPMLHECSDWGKWFWLPIQGDALDKRLDALLVKESQ